MNYGKEMRKRIKVLAIAYACEPYKGSEQGVGWNWVKQIARFSEVWVLTRSNNQKMLEMHLKESDNIHFIYIDTPKWMRFWKKGARGARVYYVLWQIYSFFKLRKFINLSEISVIHHITFVNDYLPSFFSLFKLWFKNLVFIWGPIGSHPKVPSRFLDSISGKIWEFLKNLIRYIARLNPFYILTKKISDAIIIIDPKMKVQLGLDRNKKVYIMPAIGVDLPREEVYRMDDKKKAVNILFAGRLVNFKGPQLAIKAFYIAKNKVKTKKNIRMFFVGDGKERTKIENFIQDKSLEKDVVILGWIERKKLLEMYKKCDIFLYPSFEGGGMVVLEAMASGLPIICLDFGGPGKIVTESCGFKIKVTTLKQTVEDLSIALLKLIEDYHLRIKMGRAAKNRVEQLFTWNKKGEFLMNLYAEVLKVKL